MVGVLREIDQGLASKVADGLGIAVPTKLDKPLNMSFPADANPDDWQPTKAKPPVEKSAALSMAGTVKNTIKTRKVAILAADGVDGAALTAMQKAIVAAGGQTKIVAPKQGTLKTAKGDALPIDYSLLTTSSVLFDAVYVPGGEESVAALTADADAIHFINEAYRHCKSICATGEGEKLLQASYVGASGSKPKGEKQSVADGILVGAAKDVTNLAANFISAIGAHRHWQRETASKVPA